MLSGAEAEPQAPFLATATAPKQVQHPRGAAGAWRGVWLVALWLVALWLVMGSVTGGSGMGEEDRRQLSVAQGLGDTFQSQNLSLASSSACHGLWQGISSFVSLLVAVLSAWGTWPTPAQGCFLQAKLCSCFPEHLSSLCSKSLSSATRDVCGKGK